MTKLVIPRTILSEMLLHLKECYPLEGCGLLAGEGEEVKSIYKMTNADASGVTYLMDSMEQFRAMKEMRLDGMKLLSIYHSHPQSVAHPSSTDIRLASYPDAVCIIVSLAGDAPVINGFLIDEGNVRKVEIEIKET